MSPNAACACFQGSQSNYMSSTEIEISQFLFNDYNNNFLFCLFKLVQAGFPPYLEPRVIIMKSAEQYLDS